MWPFFTRILVGRRSVPGKSRKLSNGKNLYYYYPAKTAKITQKRKLVLKRKRITELKKKRASGFLLCLDTIVIY